MKVITYKCDLCGYTFNTETLPKDIKAFYINLTPHKRGLTDNISTYNKHICNLCIEAIKNSTNDGTTNAS